MLALKLKEIDRRDYPAFIENVYTSAIEMDNHVHNKAQLIYAEGGVIHVFTEEQHWYLPGRFYMWIPAGVSHRISSNSSHITLFNFYFDVEENNGEFYQKPNIYLVNDLLREMILFTRSWSGPVTEMEPYKMAMMRAIKLILPELDASSTPFMLKHPYPKNESLLAIAKYIRENIGTPYTIDQIARIFGLSTRTLSRLFKRDLGFGYVRFVRALRMSSAMELMAQDKYTVMEIAELVGFSSLSSFSNIFLKVVGIRPTEYMAKFTNYKEGALKSI